MSTYLPDQTVSDKSKLKEQWYVPTYDYWIEKCVSLRQSSELQIRINAANGEVDFGTLDYLLKPFNIESSDLEDLNAKYPYNIRNTNIITPIIENRMGEYIELPYKVSVNFHDPDLASLQNDMLKEKLKVIMETTLAKILENKEAEPPSAEELNNLIQQEKDKFIKQESLKAQRFLNYINEKQNFDYYRLQLYYNWLTTEECYVYRTFKDGDFIKTVLSPQYAFPYLGDNDFVDDSLAFVFVESMSWEDFYNNHVNDLDNSQLDYIHNLHMGDKLGGTISAPINLITERTKLDWYSIDTPISVDPNLTSSDRIIKKYTIVFQAYRKVKELRYIDQLTSKERTTIVSNDYVLEPSYGDISLTTHIIAESWEGCRFGGAGVGLYTRPKKHLVQRPGKIPVTGKQYMLKNKLTNPIAYRLLAYQVIDSMLMVHIEKALNKYKDDILIIPKSILAEDNAGTAKEKTFYMMKDGRIIYDDAKVDLQLAVQGIRLIQGSSTDKYISTLINLQQYFNKRALESVSSNSDRLGNVDTRGGVANVEQNIYRSKLGSVLALEIFRKILEIEHETDLDYAKYIYIDGVSDTMFDAEGNITQVELNGFETFRRSYGVHVENGITVDKKLDMIRQMALSAAQNGDFDQGVAAVKHDSIEEIQDVIAKLKAAKEQFERDMEERKNSMVQEQLAAAKEQLDTQHNYKIDEILNQGDVDANNLVIQKEYDITIQSMNNDTSMTNSQMDSETARLSNESRERIASAQAALKANAEDKKIKAQKEIAKVKTNKNK